MVSHINYKVLNVNEDFVIDVTSKLTTYFIDGFTSRMKSQINCLFTSGNIYILDSRPLAKQGPCSLAWALAKACMLQTNMHNVLNHNISILI